MKPTTTLSPDRFLWFNRAGIRFAAVMEHLQEVLPLTGLRPLPASEPALAGLMVLRDTILPVFDPALLLSSTPAPLHALVHAIVLRLEGQAVFAVMAEEVGQVISLPPPARMSCPVRLAAAFAGEWIAPDKTRSHNLDIPRLAAVMGLHNPIPASTPIPR
jgi:chemotaxis signal transduction protein